MVFVPAPRCAEIALCFVEFDQQYQNVYHVQKTTPYDATSLAEVAALFKDWHEDSIAPTQSSSVGLARIIAKAMDVQNDTSIEYTTGLPIVGGQTTDPGLPGNVTVAVKWSTGFMGRSFRGRTYHIGLCEGMVNGNKVNESPLAALLGGYQTLLSMLELTDHHLVIVSKWENKVQRTTAEVNPVISCSIDEWVDSQRRRLTGRGA